MFGKDIIIREELLSNETRKYTNSFTCGNDYLDDKLKYEAPINDDLVTYLFIDCTEDVLVAFISVSRTPIQLFVFENENEHPNTIQSIEIKYFGVHTHYQNIKYKYGSQYVLSQKLLDNAICIIKENFCQADIDYRIILYSVPDTVRFYSRCRFREFDYEVVWDDGVESYGCIPMYLEIN